MNLVKSPNKMKKLSEEGMLENQVEEVSTLQRTRRLMSKLVISHDHTLRKCWDALMAVVLMYICIVLPYSLALYGLPYHEDPPLAIQSIDLCIDYLFYIDIVLNFITSYENADDETVADLLEIGRNYIVTGWFFLDFISTVPLERVLQSSMLRLAKIGKVLRVLKLMKMMRLGKLKRLIQKLRARFDISNTVLAMVKYGAMIIFCAHWFSCILWLVPRFQNFPKASWVWVYLADQEDGPAMNRT